MITDGGRSDASVSLNEFTAFICSPYIFAQLHIRATDTAVDTPRARDFAALGDAQTSSRCLKRSEGISCTYKYNPFNRDPRCVA
jgi:hypothetical protein